MVRARNNTKTTDCYKTRLGLIFGILFVVVSFVAVLPTHHVAAATNASWVDSKTIKYGGLTYTDKGEGVLPDGSGTKAHVFAYLPSKPTCNGEENIIYFGTSTDVSTATKANYMSFWDTTGASGSTGVCSVQAKTTIALGNTQADVANPDESGDKAGEGATASSGCESGGSPLGWFMCPIYEGAGNFTDWLLREVLQPFLRTTPVSTDPSDTGYKVWSMFRVYGDIFLVIALLVVVFGQSIGGGLVDAYTAKKVLPRLLIAAILINLSIYIVAFLVDVTNVIGGSIGTAMTAPLQGQGLFSISPSGATFGKIAGITAGGTVLGALATGFTAVFSSAFFPFIGLFVLMPAVLATIVLFVTLALRKAVILALILVAPVAFALYCLPNTEQYFRKWWDVLTKALMVYPIVMIMFAVADILAVTVTENNPGTQTLAVVISFLLQFLPLFLIPYAMRLSGSALASVHDAITEHRKRGQEAVKGNVNDPWSLRNQAKRKASNAMLTKREANYERGSKLSDRRGFGLIGKGLAGIAGHGNIEELRSRRNKEASEMHAMHIATGGDRTSRALFAKKNANDEWEGTNGTIYTNTEVSKARSMYGRDPSMFQAALTYEIGKASNDSELTSTLNRGEELMSDLKLPSRSGITTGAFYNHQQTRRELKHTKRATNAGTGKTEYTRNASNYSQEVAETVNNWSLGNMRTSSIDALINDYNEAGAAEFLATKQRPAGVDEEHFAEHVSNLQAKIAENEHYLRDRGLDSAVKASQVRANIQSTADSLDSRFQSRGSYALAGEDGNQVVSGGQTGAAGLVNDRIGQLVRIAAGKRGGGSQPTQAPPTAPSPPPAGSGGWQSGGGSGGGGGGTPSGGSGGGGIIIPPSGYTGSQG